MKKLVVFASAACLMTAVAFGTNLDKGKKKKCAKGKTCCTKTASAEKKSCCKSKAASTVKM